MTKSKKFLRLHEAEEETGLAPKEVRRLIQAGALPGSYRPGGKGHWLVPRARLLAWLEREQARDAFAPRPQRTRGGR